MIVYSILQKDLLSALFDLGLPTTIVLSKDSLDIHIEEYQKLSNLDEPFEINYTFKDKVKPKSIKVVITKSRKKLAK